MTTEYIIKIVIIYILLLITIVDTKLHVLYEKGGSEGETSGVRIPLAALYRY